MILDTGRTRLTRGWAVIARLLTVAFLLASLLVPPFAEAASGGAAPMTVAVSVAMDQDGGPDAPSRPHGIVHAGSHCACQVADRLTPPLPVGPTVVITVGRPAFTDHAHASLEAEPPARPPRA
ncbi:hypothetical protein [Roseicella aerolata]|uniref:DUF2946 domain-containing protein n=1 Tax=Roseicella aerolata TaxID=2883479 RepID=A0A9X1ILV2_9PROT|nr:hypothetical protein [Roseicella aerolata]MCB4825515.1 hypothetical protein [Roseicella aerolata]